MGICKLAEGKRGFCHELRKVPMGGAICPWWDTAVGDMQIGREGWQICYGLRKVSSGACGFDIKGTDANFVKQREKK